MNVLIACEESQRVCVEFRNLGHQAFSCDLLSCSGGHPEWHIWGNVVDLFQDDIFYTMDGTFHKINYWDLIIAHPPCTYLTVSGNKWFNPNFNKNVEERINARQNAIEFFMFFVNLPCNKIAIENPIGVMSSVYRKPDQIIQPYLFGDKARKSTCLWLKNLPTLKPTNIVSPGIILEGGFSVGACANYAIDDNGKILPWNDPRTAIARSKTFPGIAKAMAEQWG